MHVHRQQNIRTYTQIHCRFILALILPPFFQVIRVVITHLRMHVIFMFTPIYQQAVLCNHFRELKIFSSDIHSFYHFHRCYSLHYRLSTSTRMMMAKYLTLCKIRSCFQIKQKFYFSRFILLYFCLHPPPTTLLARTTLANTSEIIDYYVLVACKERKIHYLISVRK